MDQRADQMLSKMEKTLIKEYRRALKQIRRELAELYVTFPMNKKQRMQRQRLSNLEKMIIREINRIYAQNTKLLIDSLAETYQEMYYMTGWAIEMELAGAQLTWGFLKPEVIKQAVLAPIDKLTLNDRLQRNRKRIIAEIKHQLTQGLILGDSYEEMAQRMKKVLEQDVVKSRTIARTEGHRVRNQGKMESAKKAAESGLNMVKVWDATLDKRTRPAHRWLDGTIVGVHEDFVSMFGGRGLAPGLMKTARDDINCRCIFRLQLVGYEPQERRIRGEGTGEYMTYEQWAIIRGYK